MGNLICPYCNNNGKKDKFVEVHGHIQCSRCKTNIDPCCQGSQNTKWENNGRN